MGQQIYDGGLQFVPQIAAVQYVYLDFDGELTSYNGEILTVENVEVQHSELSEERIKNILTELNKKYAAENIIFVTEIPPVEEYSTIYIGKTEAFTPYGSFAGLAETLDENNQIKTDKAFVMLNATNSNEEIINTISHETDHLLGTLNHGGEGLAAYAAHTIIGAGTTSTGLTINSGNSVTVSSGGVATRTTVNDWGRMYIYSGGVANSTTVNSKGSMYISSGGVASSTTVNSYGAMTISSGGVANSTTVNSRGYIIIRSGGVAKYLSLKTGGNLGGFSFKEDKYFAQINGSIEIAPNVSIVASCMYISSGGVANSTTVNGGDMYIEDGGVANSTTVNSSGYVFIFSGGVANSITVNSYGRMYISSGGEANNTTVNSGGSARLSSGATLKGCNTLAGTVIMAGTANATGATLNFAVDQRKTTDSYIIDNLSLITGAPTYTITVSASQDVGTYKLAAGASSFTGTISIGNGTTDYGSITVNGSALTYGGKNYSLVQSSGNLTLNIASSASVAANVKIYSSGTLTSQGSSIAGAVLSSGGNNRMHVPSGGVANSTTVNASGGMYINSGGVANSTTVNSGGGITIYSGGVANNTTVNFGGKMYVSSGGCVSSLTLVAGGILNDFQFDEDIYIDKINNDTIAVFDNVYIRDNGLHISNGGSVNGTYIGSYRTLHVSSGGTANNISIGAAGRGFVSQGGVANQVGLEYLSELHVVSGGKVNNAVFNGGSAYVSNGGIVDNTLVNSGYLNIMAGGRTDNAILADHDAILTVYSGATAYNTTVKTNGRAFYNEDAIIAGSNSFAGNIFLSGEVNAANATIDFAVSEISPVDSAIIDNLSLIAGTPNYTITVAEAQRKGDFKLASGAANFNGTITVKNTGGDIYGFLSCTNNKLTYNETDYTLIKDSSGLLSLRVREADDVPPTISNVSLIQGDGNYTFVANISAFDNKTATGNLVYQIKYAKSLADLETASAVSGKSFMLNANEAGKDWYYQVGVTDSNRNTAWSEAAQFTVKDVTVPVLNGSPSVIVNGQKATFSWSAASDNVGVAGYYLTVDGNKYTVTGTSYTLSNLAVGSHCFTLSAYDAAGNESSKSTGKSFTIAEPKDTVKPTISSVSIAQGAGNYTFTATVSASDNKTAAANLTYQIKYATTQAGLSNASVVSGKSFTLNANAAGKTYYYQIGVTDEAGNTTWSTAKSTTVKDVTKPTLNGSPTSTVNGQSVTISWNAASDNLAVKGYYLTVDGNKYSVTGNSYTLNNLAVGNHTFTLSAYDAAGNESSKSTSKSFTITAPEPETIGSTFKWYGTEYVYVQENGVTKSDFKWNNSWNCYTCTNNDIVDAEKGSRSDSEFFLYMNTCWAATASNMFVRAGWSDGIFSSEDAILEHFCEKFKFVNYYDGTIWLGEGVGGGRTHFGVNWLLGGFDTLCYSSEEEKGWRFYADAGWSIPKNTQDGGFYKADIGNPSISNYILRNDGYGAADFMETFKKLQEGYSVGLSVGWYVTSGNQLVRKGGHAITVYGFTYDESKKGTPDYFTGIIVADSDDDFGSLGSPTSYPAAAAPNRIKILDIEYVNANIGYLFTDYGPSNRYGIIDGFQYLVQRPDDMTYSLNSGVGFTKNADWNDEYSLGISEEEALNNSKENKISAADDIYVAVNLSNSGLGNSGSFTITAVIDEDAENALTFNISKVLAYGESDDQTVINLGKLSKGVHNIVLTVTDGNITNSININNLYVAYAKVTEDDFMVNAGQVNNGANISSDQSLIVMGNGAAIGAAINANGEQVVKANGSAEQSKIYANGMLTVENGGTASKAEVFENGFLIANGSVNETTVHSGGALFADKNSEVKDTKIEADGWMDINYQGSAENTDVYGNLMVTNGTAEETTVYAGGTFMVVDDGVSDGAVIQNSGKQYVADGGNASNNTFTGSLSEQYVFAEGSIATGNTFDGGSQIVASGGMVSDNTLNNYAVQDLSEGAVAVKTTLNSNSTQYIWKAVAYDTTVNAGSMAFVLEGGVSVNCTVKSAGYIIVGDMDLFEEDKGVGAVKDLTVEYGAYAMLEAGAVLYGTTTVAGSLAISGEVMGSTATQQDASPVMVFDFSGRSGEDGYMVSNITLISDLTYSLIFDDAQLNGTYKLSANGGADFNQSISVYDDTGIYYGALSVNDKVLMGDQIVTLENLNGALNLVVKDSPYSAYEIPEEQVQTDGSSCYWGHIANSDSYIIQFSRDNFQTFITVETADNAISFNNLPFDLQWRIKAKEANVWTDGDSIKADYVADDKLVHAAKDWEFDILFATADKKWEDWYSAQHLGIVNGWAGTGEKVELDKKNKISDIFEGSSDANILLLTDDANGDALFVDDIYTALPGTVTEQQARIDRINEIRAGVGDDIVDMTSMQFAYAGDGVKIYGGLGNDTIWANKGSNTLFGDAGDDRIVGASGNDWIIGGAGNDSMHGGGGSDTFCFGSDWGVDTVEQLDGGSVTLWFEAEENQVRCNGNVFTFGENKVEVIGENLSISLKFGSTNDAPAGAFADSASEKIFEDKNFGSLA